MCGIQNEGHMVFLCDYTKDLREKYDVLTMADVIRILIMLI